MSGKSNAKIPTLSQPRSSTIVIKKQIDTDKRFLVKMKLENYIDLKKRADYLNVSVNRLVRHYCGLDY